MSQSSPSSSPPVAAVRLFQPDARPARPAERLSPAMRLAELWEAYGRPVVARAKRLAPETIAMYDDSVRLWTALTADRPLEAIAEDDGADYLEGLRYQPGLKDEFLAPRTVRRHVTDLQRILDLAGPRSRYGTWGRYAQHLVERVPYLEPPEVPKRLPSGDFTHAEVLAILAACPRAKVHEDYPGDGGEFWTALVTFLCATGLRIRETMDLRWSMIARQTLLIPAAITKSGADRATYVPPQALVAIAPLRRLAPSEAHRIFPWPNWPGAGAWRWLHRRREQLVAAAGLAEARRFGFHGFRKYYGTAVFTAASATSGAPAAAAAFALGHESTGVTLGHYISPAAQLGVELARQRAIVDRLPLFQTTAGG